jgi:hypothetical protein
MAKESSATTRTHALCLALCTVAKNRAVAPHLPYGLLDDVDRWLGAEWGATPAEPQVAKTLYFPPDLVPYIAWETLGEQMRELACHLKAERHTDGGVTVTLFWESQ